MNIPEIYLVEPYNCYAPKGRKKHWHEIVEEQALMARILAEQQAQQRALLEAQTSKTLPPNSPPISTPTVGGTPQGGAGGTPAWDFWNQSAQVIDFTATPSTGIAPLTVTFTDTTSGAVEFDTFLWTFGDGTTSTLENPTHVYNTGSFSASLQITSSNGFMTSSRTIISGSIPEVTANYTFTTSSVITPYSASFVNTSINTSQTPTTTYKWIIINGNTTTTSSAINLSLRIDSGSFTASLQATGSYGIANTTSSRYSAPAPTLVAGFTFTTSSNSAPSNATFLNTLNGGGGTQYNGNGTLTYLWNLGSGSLTANTQIPNPQLYTVAASYTASLQVTESSYNIKSNFTRSWRLT